MLSAEDGPCAERHGGTKKPTNHHMYPSKVDEYDNFP